ncbi:unnamed protein product [Oppiella nova]|uniref:Carboxylesterase type B domain-containing protein n=1 Tax=Oppiella nova TaxID=334625 RepID=A0A7R9M2A9_9ACAR|nr:unnamed protein product [Oppiella nova]CAG2169441.1 unnamed protein product [Oppiella nova]
MGYQPNKMTVFGCNDRHMCHGASSQYVYGKPVRYPQMFSETDYGFSLDVMKMWTNFAKNIKLREEWPLFLTNKPNVVPKVEDLNPNPNILIQ